MATIQVFVCDRCERRLEPTNTVDLRLATPGANGRPIRKQLDLCGECGEALAWFAQKNDRRQERGRVTPEEENALARVRSIAADAVAAWNVGDTPDDLLRALTDVATGAKR